MKQTLAGACAAIFFSGAALAQSPLTVAVNLQSPGPTIPPDEVYKPGQCFDVYRWHITDPVRFNKNRKVTIQALGWKKGGFMSVWSQTWLRSHTGIKRNLMLHFPHFPVCVSSMDIDFCILRCFTLLLPNWKSHGKTWLIHFKTLMEHIYEK